jgi:hypothetical protein
MRVVEVGAFLLPRRLTLTGLLAGGRELVRDALHAEFSEFAAPEPLASGGLVLDYHRSLGGRQMETMLFEGSIQMPSLGVVQLYVSSLSVGFVVTQLDIPDGESVDLERGGGQTAFKQQEDALTKTMFPVVSEWSARIERTLHPEWTQERPPSAMVAGQLLWWHRVAIDPPPGSEFASPRWFGVEVVLRSDVRCSVGDGFTNVHGDAGPFIEQIVEGIMFATQEWLVIDDAQRFLAEHLKRLSQVRAGDLITVDGQYGEVLLLTEEVTLRKLLISEERRYLANTRARVKDAATECWGMAEQATELEGRIGALRELFLLHRERITNDRDERRNVLVFVLTAVTLIQSVLIWYDFLTEPNNSIAGDPRPAIATGVLVLTLAVVIVVIWNQVRERRRRAELEIRRGINQSPRGRRPAAGSPRGRRPAAPTRGQTVAR